MNLTLALFPLKANYLRETIAFLGKRAAGLNERGIPTARGGAWTATQVMRVMERNEPNRPLELSAAAA
jgi:hypothetical protein